jgi:hypothetical protein
MGEFVAFVLGFVSNLAVPWLLWPVISKVLGARGVKPL